MSETELNKSLASPAHRQNIQMSETELKLCNIIIQRVPLIDIGEQQ